MTRTQIRRCFKAMIDGVYCSYCKQHKPKAALYRVYESTYNGEHRNAIYAVCTDAACVAKAKTSRVADQWKRC